MFEKHVHLANQRSKRLKNKFKVHLGESRSLNFPDDFAKMIMKIWK